MLDLSSRQRFLADCEKQILDHRKRLNAVCGQMSDQQLRYKPSEAPWNSGQILRHLVLASRPYVEKLLAAIDTAPAMDPGMPVQLTWVGRFLSKSAGPDGNAPAPRSMWPEQSSYSSAVVRDFDAQLEAWLGLKNRAAGLDVNRKIIRNPFMSLLRMNLADCLCVAVNHHERHIRQIEAIASHPGYLSVPG